MPRPTSLLDSVGYVESRVYANLWAWPCRRQAREVARPGGVSRTHHWWVRNPRRRRAAWIAFGLAAFTSVIIAAALPLKYWSLVVYPPAASVFLFSGLFPRWIDARVGGVRFLRSAPLRRIARERNDERRAALGVMAVHLLQLRHAERLRDTRRYVPRAQDIHVSPRAQSLHHLSFVGLYVIIATQALASLGIKNLTTIGLWLMPVCLVVMLAMTFRRSVSDRVDKRQAAGRCPDCDYDVSALGDDPAIGGLVPGCGPASCPECGVVYPLVPPPTGREVAEGNRPVGVM